MSTKTDTAQDLLPTLRAALANLDDALDNLAETTEAHALVFAEAEVSDAADSVRVILHNITESLATIA